jgi:hypothetical protein
MVKKFTKKALDNYKKIVVSELKRQLNKPGSNLENSIVGGKINNADGFTISMNEYGTFVNDGRRPGKFPPRQKIEDWINKKGIKPKTLKSGKTPTLRQLGFLIGRSISRNGIQPVRFFDVIDKIEPKMTKEIEAAYLKDLELELDKKIPKQKK